MIKFVVSRYNHESDWLKEYAEPEEVVMYDRSKESLEGSIVVPNVGSDIYDKLSFIIDNYDNLPDVAVYTKCNLFKYIAKEEFDQVKDNQTFTPLLTQNHKTYPNAQGIDVCFYAYKMYYELNNLWFLGAHPVRDEVAIGELMGMLGTQNLSYIPFAPGSNYILPKETILKYPKEFYEKLRWYLHWDRYPGEAMIIERGLYMLWS